MEPKVNSSAKTTLLKETYRGRGRSVDMRREGKRELLGESDLELGEIGKVVLLIKSQRQKGESRKKGTEGDYREGNRAWTREGKAEQAPSCSRLSRGVCSERGPGRKKGTRMVLEIMEMGEALFRSLTMHARQGPERRIVRGGEGKRRP